MQRVTDVYDFTVRRFRFVLITILILFLFLTPLTLLSSSPAAAASLKLSADRGSPGTQISFTGMSDNTVAKWTLYWGSYGGVTLANGISSAGVASGSFIVPEIASGPYSVVLRDDNSGNSSLAAFVVTPSITVNPTTATPGATIKVEGYGFYSNEQGIFLTLDDTKINTFGFTSDSNGRWATTFSLPEVTGGPAHLIEAFGSTTLTSSVPPVVFAVTPAITVTPLAGALGSTVSVSGKGFALNETGVTVIWDGVTVASTSASINGNWATTFIVPRSVRGTHVLDAYGITTPSASIPDISFSATSGISVTPDSGPAGTEITVTATGFAALEAGIVVALDSRTVRDGIKADRTGSWTATITVPHGVGGNLSVNAWGPITPVGAVATPNFRVTAKTALGSNHGKVGEAIMVSGSSFTADDIININWDGTIPIATFAAGTNGDFDTTFKVPDDAGGAHRLRITGTNSAFSVENDFTVEPILTVSPPGGNVGSTITLKGSGFGAGRVLTVTWDLAAITLPSVVTTDRQGAFTAAFPAPPAKSGGHTLKASVGDVTLDSIWTMEGSAPPVPTLLKPARNSTIGLIGDTDLELEWSTVNDPSGLTYTLQVAGDAQFMDILIEQSGLRVPKYTYSRAAQGTYYWRVKAVDTASNEGAWSTVFSVQSGLMPIWLLALAVCVILGLAVGTGLWAKGRLMLLRRISDRHEPARAASFILRADLHAKEVIKPVKGLDTGETDTEQWVACKMVGLTDRDIPGLLTDMNTVPCGLTANKILKIIGHLEEKGVLAQTAEGIYRKVEPTAQDKVTILPVPENIITALETDMPVGEVTNSGTGDFLVKSLSIDEPSTDNLVIDRMEGLTVVDIPRVASDVVLKARGVTLAGLFSLCARLEREGKLPRDSQGRYHNAIRGT